ncbi:MULTISPECIES: phage tail length tape measure family protein [Pseudomonas]|uniref:phage tail length tape measure family protein n=1 Tax=Pseudomonas TaxID=286 RepID=UPI000CFEC7EA|nr:MULTISPECIES: phage tail length tape measure family protein [Pseudomonas]PRA53167.1 tail length tape measure protein [Pseudomonas sp. MYb115]QXN52231.1 phage tail length tape measure family protein [Pseudomonas fluorescens]WSO26562.1 phage tail length tape measure family protein [Pseudomonas fluorescens]
MAQESRLAVTIDSRGAKRSADDLTGSLERMERAGDAAAASADGVSSSLDDQRKELTQLLGQINPTVAALGRLDDMQEKLAKLKKAGIVESDTFVEYTQRINTMRDALGETTVGMNKAGMSAKAYQAALRGVPAQFTDIAVSLQGGQAPLQVLLQQGGQLKDMFGGIVPATKALGGYILGLVNPFTVAAAAAGTLALAYYQGSEESERLTASIIKNGNAAGTSYSELASLAQQVANTGTTVGAAADVIGQLSAAGNRLTPMYAQIAQASLAWAKQTGTDVTKVVETFNDIAKSPVEAVKKLDAELNFLTTSQYANITSLQEQGRTLEAARVATDLYASTLSSRSGEMQANLGSLESAWQSLAGFAKQAWDAMLDVGRKKTPEQELSEVYNQIADAQKGIKRGGRAAFQLGVNQQSLDQLEKRATELQGQIAQAGVDAWQAGTTKIVQDAGKKGIDLINSTFQGAQTQTAKLQKQLVDLDKARADALKSGGLGAAEETKYAAARKNIEKEIADIKEREAKKNKPKAVTGLNRGVAEAENTFSRLYGQYDPAAQAARALTKEQTQLDLALSTGKISQEEYGKALAQASNNYASALKGAQGLTVVEQYRAQLQKQLANEQAQYNLDAASVGMGDLQTSRMQQRLNLEMQTNDRLLQLQTELANATDEKQRQALQGQINAVNEFLPQQIAAMQAGWAQMDQAMLNPINGWTAAVQNFGNEARDIAGQTQSIFSSSFNTIANDITSAIKSGSLSFKTLGDIGADVLDQVITGFIRMGVQMAMNAALNATLGASAAATNIALAGTTASAWAPAAAMASLATLGTNAVPAATALTSTTALAAGLAVVPGFATGGYVSGAGTGTSDSIMARLSDGEFVVNAQATKRNRSLLEAINSNERVSVAGRGGSVAATQPSNSPAPVAAQPNVTVNLIEDRSRAGTVDQRTGDNGQLEIDAFVADIWGGGERAQALESAYGLTRQGT